MTSFILVVLIGAALVIGGILYIAEALYKHRCRKEL